MDRTQFCVNCEVLAAQVEALRGTLKAIGDEAARPDGEMETVLSMACECIDQSPSRALEELKQRIREEYEEVVWEHYRAKVGDESWQGEGHRQACNEILGEFEKLGKDTP